MRKTREQAAQAQAARAAEQVEADTLRQDQRRAAQQMAVAMQGDPQGGGGSEVAVIRDEHWNTSWPWMGAYYETGNYGAYCRDKVLDRMYSWRQRWGAIPGQSGLR